MKVTNFFIKFYSLLYARKWLPSKACSLIRWMVRHLAWVCVPPCLEGRKRRVRHKKDIPVYVSFTSFPERINYVWQVVECMLRQTYLPEKIILWLSKDQFPDMSKIPESLTCRMNDIFEIRLVEGDIRSHKKYYYVSHEYPNKYVFLIDDDLYYSTDLLERTWETHIKHPDSIICNYGYIMTYSTEGKLRPYSQWKRNHAFSISEDLFFGSGGGTLLIPERMYKDMTNIDLALQLAPLADDVWLNTMARLSDYHIVIMANGTILPYQIKKKRKLSEINIEERLNDKQIDAVCCYYKDVFLKKP